MKKREFKDIYLDIDGLLTEGLLLRVRPEEQKAMNLEFIAFFVFSIYDIKSAHILVLTSTKWGRNNSNSKVDRLIKLKGAPPNPMSQKRINLSELGKMLNASFSSSELSSMAFDISFGLHDEISHLSKSKKVIEIIKHSALHGDLEKILKFTKENNSFRYHEFLPVLYEDGDPNELIKGLSPVSDEDSNDVKEILSGMKELFRLLNEKGMGDNITFNVGAGGVLAYGDGTTAIGSGGVNVSGDNSEPIVTGNNNSITDNRQHQDFDVGANANISGNVGVMANDILNSFNKAEQLAVPDELKIAMKTLLNEVSALANKVGDSKNLKIIKKMSSNLVDEVEDEILDEKQAVTYVQRLKNAAENIGEIAKPVIDTAVAVVVALKSTGIF